jgi:tetratricopeptide (TPR) repeat protein
MTTFIQTLFIQTIALATVLCLTVAPAYAQGAGIEWETLNQEVMELYRTGQYGRAVKVAEAALKVAEKNVGPDHPAVATSLNNLAELYRATKRIVEAEKLEERAARIRAIKR